MKNLRFVLALGFAVSATVGLGFSGSATVPASQLKLVEETAPSAESMMANLDRGYSSYRYGGYRYYGYRYYGYRPYRNYLYFGYRSQKGGEVGALKGALPQVKLASN
jgi:hypothetical protein